jgi:hypothetical protein
MNRPPNLCLFCGQPGNMSEQHIFPDRLKHLLPRRNDGRYQGSWERLSKGKKVISSDHYTKEKQGSMGNSRLRRVCKSCNNGWLNMMEQECVPIMEQLIRGELTKLHPPEQEKLARVAMSMAMVREQLERQLAITTQEERETFRRTLHPPPGWFVFLGKSGLAWDGPGFLSDGLANANEKGVLTREKVFTSFTMAVGPVLLHVLTLMKGIYFDVGRYGSMFGLVAICPTTTWINFDRMPTIDADQVARMRSYAGASFKDMFKPK